MGFEPALLRRIPGAHNGGLDPGLETVEGLARLDAGPDRPRLAQLAEMTDTGERQGEGRRLHRAKRRIDILSPVFRNLTDEAQCNVIVVGLDPACAGNAAFHRGERLAQRFGKAEADKEADHALGPVRS